MSVPFDLASRIGMTGVNVTTLISSTIAILTATRKEYNFVKDDNTLREAFHEAGRGLLLVEKALQTAETQLDGGNLVEDPQNAMSQMEDCNTKAKLSETIFKDVAQGPEASRFERYKVAVRREGKDVVVEVLVVEMMRHVCDLAKASVIEAAMEGQVKALRDAIYKLSTMESSVSDERSGDMFSNSGSGSQFNAPRGTQSNNTGSGNQFPGATFSGSVSFGPQR